MRKGIILFFVTFIVSSYSFTPSYAALLPSAGNMSLPANEPDPAKIRAAVNEFMSLPKKEIKDQTGEKSTQRF